MEDDVDVWRYAIVSCMPETTTHQMHEVDTPAIDGWVVTFGTVRRGLGRAAACPCPSSLYQM